MCCFFFFFSFLFTPFFFFFSFGVALFFFFSFRCWTFHFFHSDGCHICSSCFWPFFFLELSCIASFLFYFHAFFFFFLLVLRCFSSSLFGVGLFSFFFLGGAEFVLLVFGLFSLFLIFWGPCVFSLSFNRRNKLLQNRFPIVLSCFSDRLHGTMVTQS